MSESKDTLIALLARLADDKPVDYAYAKDDFFSGAEFIARRQIAQRAYEIAKSSEISVVEQGKPVGWLVSYQINEKVAENKFFVNYSEAKAYQRELEENGWMETETFQLAVLLPKRESVYREMSKQWQPIETAPKDAEKVRLFIPYAKHLFSELDCTDEGYWEPLAEQDKKIPHLPKWGLEAGGCWRFSGDDGPFDIQPTHWMPIKTEIEDGSANG